MGSMGQCERSPSTRLIRIRRRWSATRWKHSMASWCDHMQARAPKSNRCAVLTTEPDCARLQDILVNNAGINIPKRSLQDISIEDWRQVIDININGAFHLIHAVLPCMRAQQDGLIVNITSIAGKRTISKLAGSSYCASKFAMNSLGEAINVEEYENGECDAKAGLAGMFLLWSACQVFAARTSAPVRSSQKSLTSVPTRRRQKREPRCCSPRISALRC